MTSTGLLILTAGLFLILIAGIPAVSYHIRNYKSSRFRITQSANYKWWVYAAVGIGMFLTVMDQSGLNIALPRIAEHFDADLPTVQWVILSYVLATSALVMPMGRLSDMVGRKRVYLIGFVIFVAAAIASRPTGTLA